MSRLIAWILLIGVLIALFITLGGLKSQRAIIVFVIVAIAAGVIVSFFLRSTR
jgi:hypothetical protein